MSGKALKFETAASELFSSLRGGGKASVDSAFFMRRYFLKETPAFIIFRLILGIPAVQRRVDINHCESADTRGQLLQWEQSTSKIAVLSGLTPLHVNTRVLHRGEECRQQRRGQPLHRGYCEGLTLFLSSHKTAE